MSLPNIVIFVLVFLILWLIFIFNSLVRRRNRVNEAWADIDVQLKRRHDLIPNLVETVKGYMQHERGVLEKVTQLRSQATSGGGDIQKTAVLENNITQALRTIFAVAENYPDLKANQSFNELQKNLSAIEGEVQLARRYYNGTVRDYNIKVQT